MIKRVWTVVIAAALVTAPAAIASGKHLKLTAVVTGPPKLYHPATTYSVREGSKTVGTIVLGDANCSITTCYQYGTANLRVGKVKGKAHVRVVIKAAVVLNAPPGTFKFESATGTISNKKHGSEKLRFNGEPPRTTGSKVTFVLSY